MLDTFLDRLIPFCLLVIALDTAWAAASAIGMIRLSGVALALAVALNIPSLLAAAIWLARNHRHI